MLIWPLSILYQLKGYSQDFGLCSPNQSSIFHQYYHLPVCLFSLSLFYTQKTNIFLGDYDEAFKTEGLLAWG